MGFVVYKATNTSNRKSYIGWTSRGLKVRKKEHIRAAKRSELEWIFSFAIDKHGPESFTWEILGEYDTEEEAKAAEIQMIHENNTLAPNGYNMTAGGDGTLTLCEVSREKITVRMKAQWQDEEWWQKMSEAHCGEKNGMFGREHTKESRQRMSESLRGENSPHAKLSEQQILKIYDNVWDGESRSSISEKFNITMQYVSQIKHRKVWKFLLDRKRPLKD